MELTKDHMHVLYRAWAASRSGGGIVLEDLGLYVEAQDLAERGWLERRFVTDDGEMSWWWTPAAEMALDLNALTANRSSAVN